MKVLQVFGSIVERKLGKDYLGWNTRERCVLALELLQEEHFDALLLSGGSKGVMTPAAILMKDWFELRGVDIPIVTESRSCDSWQNVEFGLESLEKSFPGKRFEIHPLSHVIQALKVWIIYRLGYKIKVTIRPRWYSAHPKYLIKGCLSLLYATLNPRGTEKGIIGLPLRLSTDRKEFHQR